MKLHTLSLDAFYPRDCHRQARWVYPELGVCRLRGRTAASVSSPVTQDSPLLVALGSCGARGSRATGRGSRSTGHASLLRDRYSPIGKFLIGCAAIKNARNSNVINAKAISNRLQIECLGALFALHESLPTHRRPPLHGSRAGARGSQALSTAHESAASSAPTHGIIVLSYARRASLILSPDARPAAGSRRGAKPASACGHLTLRH